MTVCYDREFMSGNSMLHYNSAPAIPTAIRSNLHTNEPSLTSSCTRVKYRMTIEQIMRGMSAACQVVAAVSEACAFHANRVTFYCQVTSLYRIPPSLPFPPPPLQSIKHFLDEKWRVKQEKCVSSRKWVKEKSDEVLERHERISMNDDTVE